MSPAFKYGLLTGIGLCLWLLGEFALGFHTTRPGIGAYSGYFSAVIPLTALFLLARSQHAAQPDERPSLVRTTSTGFYASFVAALIVYCFLNAYNQVINPGWMDIALEGKVALLRAQGMEELAIRREILAFRQLHSPLGLVPRTLCGITLLGTLLSGVLAIFFRARPPVSPR